MVKMYHPHLTEVDIIDDDYLDLEMEKFADLSYTEGFFWPKKNNKPNENLVTDNCYDNLQNHLEESSEEVESLPSITTLLPANSKEKRSGAMGHLSCKEYLESLDCVDFENNQVILSQSDALLMDQELYEESDIEDNVDVPCKEALLECRWEGCWSLFATQRSLVTHIEKSHVENGRSGGEDFPCFWEACPRRTRPFNARYKLLIHMRVHSGEKPNKCRFAGCCKSFSRLENLKIHQRSHTGERPYACQFPTCKKAFSNSSDRAKHQRTHFDTKPYACNIDGCKKKYTDPSSLRKHIKNHFGPNVPIKPKKLIASKPIVFPAHLQSRTRTTTVSRRSSSDRCSYSESGESSSYDSHNYFTVNEQFQDRSDPIVIEDTDHEDDLYSDTDSFPDALDSDVEKEFLDFADLETSTFLCIKEEDLLRTLS